MSVIRERSLAGLAIGVSMLALAAPQAAFAQEQQPAEDETAAAAAPADGAQGEEIVVTGIRASLRSAQNIKRNAQGIVDAISAEDIGKFPDTNLAESLQRVTGVSIDRTNGEGQYVTVRGFGPEFNLVTLNGRQMPTSTLGDGVSAPSSRAFDFANLASEGIAGLEVYKSGRATVPSGGIGSLINIKTTRPLDAPSRKGSFAIKGIYDSSRRDGSKIAPEFSGIFSDTFADGRVGIAISGSYQRRKSTENAADVLYQSWATVQAPGGSWAYGGADPAPDNGAVVQTPITMGYSFMDIDRKRINGQATLQVRPSDKLTLTADYTYSQNKVAADRHRVGLWFARAGALSSGWGPGNPAPPLYFLENNSSPTDIALEGAKTTNKNLNNSLGFNARWEANDRLTLELDGHRSTARSLPDSPYGSSQSVQAAIFGAAQKRIDFTTYLPQINYNEWPGIDTLNPANYFATGNSFRNGYFRDEILQAQGRGHYDFDTSFLDSLDFGITYTDNRVRSAFGVYEQPAWGGQGTPANLPDDIFSSINVPGLFSGLKGANGDVLPAFLYFDTDELTRVFIDQFGACDGGPTCLAPYDRADSRISEKTVAPYFQINNKFDLFGNPAHLIAGLRYEKTNVRSNALTYVPDQTAWVSANEFSFLYGNGSTIFRKKGSYEEWLPSVDFDVSPLKDVKLRASYSHTITRPNYSQMRGSLSFDELRSAGGRASQGDPNLVPFKSKNIDLSAEWYYGPSSYVSIGYFRKRVSNFIFAEVTNTDLFGVRTPYGGPRYLAAVAALGSGASDEDIRDYIFANYPGSTNATGTANGHTTGQIFSLPEDPLVNFQLSTDTNSNRVEKIHGIEAAIQHSFWDTGFGVILNYTRVRSGGKFDTSLPVGEPQFAISGLSDSANAVLFYDKNGIQARVAYNWRDKFLSGYGLDPSYVEAYGQVDASASWEFRKGFTVFAEGINLTGNSRRGYSRTKNNVTFVVPGFARYALGFRYAF